jgi:putative component of membrane protein insertase Oxa1/YidC/SpoIIIJ protein YidD
MSSAQSDIDLCLKEYKTQKKLEAFISRRPLVRPNTKKWQVILLYSALPVLFFYAAIFLLWLPVAAIHKLFVCILLLLLISELYLRFCFIQTVKCYQHYAKEETRRRCLCIPSCSEYAILCFRKIFPLVVALIKIRTRLYKTCKGEDYKIDYPPRSKHTLTF